MKNSILKKSVVLILITGLIWGCSVDDGGNQVDFTYKLTPITGFEVPDTLVFDQQYDFKISFERPSNCYTFSGFDYTQDMNVRKISVVSSVVNDPEGCTPFDSTQVVSHDLGFIAKRHDFYIFKFWHGTDSIGAPQYLTKRVIVADSI